MTKEQTMTPLRTRMIEDMKLAGLAAKTQEVYLQAVSALAKHYKRSSELLTEEEVRRGPPIFAGCSRAEVGKGNKEARRRDEKEAEMSREEPQADLWRPCNSLKSG
jgi:hypothetical protein